MADVKVKRRWRACFNAHGVRAQWQLAHLEGLHAARDAALTPRLSSLRLLFLQRGLLLLLMRLHDCNQASRPG